MNDKNALEVLMRISRLSLSSVGAWPLYANKTLSRILFFISYLIVTFTVFIPQGIKLIQVRDNLDQISQILSTAELPFLIALTKMSVLYYNKEKITILYNFMTDHWRNNRSDEEMEIMMKNGDKGRRIALLCISLGHASINACLVMWIFENIHNWTNSDYVKIKNYTLYIEAYFPFNWNYTPMFEIICFIEYLGTFLATVAYVGTDALFSQIVLHFSGEYRILRLKFFNLINNFDVTIFNHEFDEKFGNIVDVHEHLNSCISILESTFYLMFLVQLLACSIQFCLQGYLLILHITNIKSSSMLITVIFFVVYLIYMIGNFYVYCYLGEQLQKESYAFSQVVYNSEWFRLPPKKAKCLLLLMQAGHKPVTITAGKFCALNLILFSCIMKTSMGYMSFMITMGRKNL